MKIRQGFVSNSSTSSFLIYGICINCPLINDENYDLEKIISENKLNLKVETGPYYEDLYVGRCPTSIKDDENGKQFKESIESDLKKLVADEKVKELFQENDIKVNCHFMREAL